MRVVFTKRTYTYYMYLFLRSVMAVHTQIDSHTNIKTREFEVTRVYD